jgi:hypothetical protein
MAHVAAPLVPAEVDQHQSATRRELTRTLQEERLSVLPRLLGEGFEVAARGADGLDVGG